MENETEVSPVEVPEVLRRFGLNENESSVYLALLQAGARPASVIATRAKLKRAHTYNVLASLAEKGIVQEFEKSGVRQFTCSPPAALVEMLAKKEIEIRQNREALVKALPLLEQIQNPFFNNPKVRFYQGINGVSEMLEDSLTHPNEVVYAFVDPVKTYFTQKPELREVITDYVKRRIEKNVWLHAIIPCTVEIQEQIGKFDRNQDAKRRVKLLQGFNGSSEIMIYRNKIAIVSANDSSAGFIIEDTLTAECLKSLHSALWSILPDFGVN